MNEGRKQQLGTDLFELLGRMNKCMEGIFDTLKYNRRDWQSFVLVSLYLTILRLSESVSILLSSNNDHGVPILVRQTLEAYVDLVLLDKDSEYIDCMHGASLEQWRKMLESWPEKCRPREWKTAHQEVLMQLKNIEPKFKRKQTIKERCDKACAHLYDFAYRELCHDSHNDLLAVQTRHSTIKDRDIDITLDKPVDYGHLAIHLHLMCTFILEAVKILHRRFGDEGPSGMEGVTKEFQKRHAQLKRLQDEEGGDNG